MTYEIWIVEADSSYLKAPRTAIYTNKAKAGRQARRLAKSPAFSDCLEVCVVADGDTAVAVFPVRQEQQA